jgi:hypothetical protein
MEPAGSFSEPLQSYDHLRPRLTPSARATLTITLMFTAWLLLAWALAAGFDRHL